jgi:predicted transcriptional regulator
MNFPTEEISAELFEVGSDQRLSIILHLNEKNWSISALAKELDATVTEVHRNFGRLQKTGFISKNVDGTYRLTVKGENICIQIPSIEFILKNSKYFENHTFGDLPIKFRQRIGNLSESKNIKGVVRVLEKWKQIHSNANEYICNILAEVPYSKEIIDVVEKKLNDKIKINSIFAENAIIPEERESTFKTKNFTKFVKDELLVRKMVDNVSVVVLFNEKESSVIFPNLNGEPDLSEMFYSDDSQFHEWCVDYFEYMWKKSSSFQESKLISE